MIGSILGAAIGGAFSLFGGNKAEKQQSRDRQAALNLQREQYNTSKDLLSPYIQGGVGAQDVYQTALGLKGRPAQQSYYDQFQFDPGFQTGLNTALDNVRNKYAIYGDVGGGLAKDLLKTGQESIGAAYDKRLSQIGGLADSGRTAAGALAGAGQTMANSSGNIISSTGKPYAAEGISNAGNALIGGIQNYQDQQRWDQARADGWRGHIVPSVPSNALRW